MFGVDKKLGGNVSFWAYNSILFGIAPLKARNYYIC